MHSPNTSIPKDSTAEARAHNREELRKRFSGRLFVDLVQARRDIAITFAEIAIQRGGGFRRAKAA